MTGTADTRDPSEGVETPGTEPLGHGQSDPEG